MQSVVDDGEVWELRPGSPSGSISGGGKPSQPQPDDVGGFGVNARLGHIAGETIDSDESRTFIQVTPFTTVDSLFLGGDFRFLRTNTGGYAGSGGAIVRRFIPSRNAIFGTNLYFDVDNSKGAQFQQVGFGFEWLSNRLDNRTNVYIPFGEDQKVLRTGTVAGSESFIGNSLLYSRFTNQVTAATGVDTMFTMPVPGRIFERINLEASAGAYYFAPNDGKIRDFGGPKLRLDATLFRRLLHMYVEGTHDNFNDSLVSFGIDVNYWNRYDEAPRLGGNQFHRITEWTRRNWSIVTSPETKIDDGIIAFNPATGAPYVIEHVDSNATALPGDGTFERPYTTLQFAQINPPDPPNTIIYAHAGSVFNTPLVMNPNEIILGEGVLNPIRLANSPDVIFLPSTGKPGGTPTFDGIAGTPVTLANNTTFGGFVIDNTTGPQALLADGITNASIYGIRVVDVNGGHGVVIRNSAGLITLDDVNILLGNPADDFTGTDLDAFRVEGGTANILYTNSLIQNTFGRAVRITGAGGTVDMRGVTVNTFNNSNTNANFLGDEGVIVQDSSADVFLGRMTIEGGSVDLLNITGDITFTQPVQIAFALQNAENPFGSPFHVNGSTGTISTLPGADLEIVDFISAGPPNIGAIDLRNISGTIRFDGDVTYRGNAANNLPNLFGPALVWQQNSGDFISNGTYTTGDFINNFAQQSQGILIGDRLGALANTAGSTFTMNGQFLIHGTYDDNGVVGTANSAIEILNDPTVVFFAGGVIQDRNPTPPPTTPAIPLSPSGGIEILNTTGTITFAGTTEIFNALPNANGNSAFPALFVNGATGDISFETLTINNAVVAAVPFLGAVEIDNSGDINFDELNVTYIGASVFDVAAVEISNSGVITAGGGNLITNPGPAIRLLNNDEIDWTSTSITAIDGLFGINVTNSPGSFTVTGVGETPGSGGRISMAFIEPGDENGAIFNGTDQTDPINIVTLRNMVFDDNDAGIVISDYNQLILDGVVVSNTSLTGSGLDVGLFLRDVPNLLITDSTFVNNALKHIDAAYATDADEIYDIILDGNQFIDGTNSANGGVSAITFDNVGATGAELNMIVRNHGGRLSGVTGFISQRSDPSLTDVAFSSDSAAFDVRWQGPATVLVENNSFLLTGLQGAKGFEFINGSLAAQTNFTYRNNILQNTAIASDHAGLFFDAAGPTNLTIRDNFRTEPGRTRFPGMQMFGAGDNAYVTRLRSGGNVVVLENNIIDMNNDDTVAFNFPFIGGATSFTINGNEADFRVNTTATAPGERGFVFGAVTGALQFSGNTNNRVTFHMPDPFSDDFAPDFISGSFGSFILNQRRVPNP
jgi:hypothetical protein